MNKPVQPRKIDEWAGCRINRMPTPHKKSLARQTGHGDCRFGLIAERGMPFGCLVDSFCLCGVQLIHPDYGQLHQGEKTS
jgi:hypothetical protein